MYDTKSPERLVYQANQIGKFFASQPGDAAVAGIAKHIADFWDPRMRAQILAHVDVGGAGLDPPVKRAIESLRTNAPAM